MANRKSKIVDVTIPVKLTDKEVEALGRDLARKEGELEDLERNKRETAGEFRLRIKAVKGRIGELSTMITTGKTERETKARIERRGSQVEYYHPRSGELIHKRAMEADERQDDLDLDGAE